MAQCDWSADVCSSDLSRSPTPPSQSCARISTTLISTRSEERRVGKSVLSRVDLGGRRIIKKKKNKIELMGQTSAAARPAPATSLDRARLQHEDQRLMQRMQAGVFFFQAEDGIRDGSM